MGTSDLVPPSPAKLDVRNWVTPEDLNVAPELLGLPLARPSRRAWAMLLDLAVIAVLSRLLANGWWLLAMMVLGGAHTWARSRGRRLAPWIWVVVAGLVAAGAYELWHSVTRPAEVAMTPAGIDVERRTPGAPGWRHEVAGWLDDVGFGYGWAMLYFSFVPAWWRGQTLGKRLFGLRVVELTGKPMTVFQCLKRHGGYAAGMATGGIGLLQLLWDSNRQAIQDKTAHTVVIDLRNAQRLPPERWPAPTR
jgi:uncharacterized RDD family membrane protein YckC